MQIDVTAEAKNGDANSASREAGDKIREFGNQLMNALGSRSPRIGLPSV
jgi:hypothetical protein